VPFRSRRRGAESPETEAASHLHPDVFHGPPRLHHHHYPPRKAGPGPPVASALPPPAAAAHVGDAQVGAASASSTDGWPRASLRPGPSSMALRMPTCKDTPAGDLVGIDEEELLSGGNRQPLPDKPLPSASYRLHPNVTPYTPYPKPTAANRLQTTAIASGQLSGLMMKRRLTGLGLREGGRRTGAAGARRTLGKTLGLPPPERSIDRRGWRGQ
jgi:hypothetical protein